MVKKFLLFLFLFAHLANSQTIAECKERFQTCLNFNASLNRYVHFESGAIILRNSSGVKTLSVYENELPAISAFLKGSRVEEQNQFWSKKMNRELSKMQCDSLLRLYTSHKTSSPRSSDKPLHGIKIAIDPGHFGVDLNEAASEQKFLYFAVNNKKFPFDSVKLFESALSFNTALLVKAMLEEQGAEIMMSRDQQNFTSFNCTYSMWNAIHKTRVLDSLVRSGKLSHAKRTRLLQLKKRDFFWDFFRDFDLQNRASKINAFHPDITLIIHFNVDEKNAPWKSFTEKDFTMTFIGGVFMPEQLTKTEMRNNFLRLLLTDQLNLSGELAGKTVEQFHKNLGIPIAQQKDAKYLMESCLQSDHRGVFSRNLLLCRQINSVLVYGEALYQDNAREAAELMKRDIVFKGIPTGERLLQVARAYADAATSFLKEKSD
jgi:N-acetylmuramoyl-L-alanine amidase